MTTIKILEQFHMIYLLLLEGKNKQAEQVFNTMQIVDSSEHLSLPKNVRHLIWDLHEYLVLKDENNATDINQIMTEFKILFPEKNN